MLKIAALQKKYKKLEEISNKTAKLMYHEPILRERLEDTKGKNNELYQAIEQLSDKYAQYSELLFPLLEINNINHQF